MPTVEEYHRDDRKQSGLKAGCTVGRGINVSIAVNFFCILISSLVVVGTVSHLKEEVCVRVCVCTCVCVYVCV